MPTLTYCKGLPTPLNEMNPLGFTKFEMFLTAYAPIFRAAVSETVIELLSDRRFNKSHWNTYIQKTYGVSKRHANGVISRAKGCVDGAKECRKTHIKKLTQQLRSANKWLESAKRKVKSNRKFYAKKNWQQSATGCLFYNASDINTGHSNLAQLKFAIHQKSRRIHLLESKISHLKSKPVKVTLTDFETFVVGSKDESFGNQTVQWDGNILTFRVPYCLEDKFGKHVSTELGWFERSAGKNRLSQQGAKAWHFYRKNEKWVAAVQFTPILVKRKVRHSDYGCIGIDLNPGAIGWAYVDTEGNLQSSGQIPLEMGLPNNKQTAQIVDAVMQLVALALCYECPIVVEKLDFSNKKSGLRERGRKNARMLSGWAYAVFNKMLDSICANRGITVLRINPAYTSIIGMSKFAGLYGLGSDCAAAMAIARRGMNLSEKLPSSMSAYLLVNDRKHVWSQWSQLNKILKANRIKRHSFYPNSNWNSLVTLDTIRLATGSAGSAKPKLGSHKTLKR